mmetsp:Transcript_28262/g.81158  ORF Transcript_28262/g.81158 Transcript_28262/m.81158 type:complete len:266 (+) Transcript_28262:617-1414(+)
MPIWIEGDEPCLVSVVLVDSVVRVTVVPADVLDVRHAATQVHHIIPTIAAHAHRLLLKRACLLGLSLEQLWRWREIWRRTSKNFASKLLQALSWRQVWESGRPRGARCFNLRPRNACEGRRRCRGRRVAFKLLNPLWPRHDSKAWSRRWARRVFARGLKTSAVRAIRRALCLPGCGLLVDLSTFASTNGVHAMPLASRIVRRVRCGLVNRLCKSDCLRPRTHFVSATVRPRVICSALSHQQNFLQSPLEMLFDWRRPLSWICRAP